MDTPVVISRIPAVTERLQLIDPDQSGLLLVDPENYEDLVQKIQIALKNREEVVARQKPLSDLLLKYTWDDAARQYQQLLTQIKST